MKPPSWLPTAAERFSQEPWSLGSLFSSYQQLEQKAREALLEDLGCSLETLQRMSLCRRPPPDRFAEQVRLIAERFQVDEARLMAVLRRAEVLEKFASTRPLPGSKQATPTLMAARDRKKGEDEE